MRDRKLRYLAVATILLVTTGACSGDSRSPTGPEPTTSTDTNYSEILRLQGRITSDADGSPISGAAIRLFDHNLCGHWQMVYGGCSELVAEATTGPDGTFNMSYSPCSPTGMQVGVSARGYRPASPSNPWVEIDCREGVQDISTALEFLPVSFLEARFPIRATVGESTMVSYRVYAHQGLAWISVDWGDGSAAEQIELSGVEAEGQLFHTYDAPGEYRRVLEVADSMGRTAKSGLRLSVTE